MMPKAMFGNSIGRAWRNAVKARRVFQLMALAVALVSTSGCNKFLANWSLRSADKRIGEAQELHADEHAPDALVAAEAAVSAARQSLAIQANKDARIQGKEAATLAKALLERTKDARANFLKSEANRWIGIVNLNEGDRENSSLYQQILTSNAEGLAAFDKQKWDGAIVAFDKVLLDADFLLQNLKGRSEAGLKDVQAMKEALVAEGAPEHYPESISEVDNFRNQISDLIIDKFDYRRALIMRDQARQSKDAGILKTKEIKSDKLLRQIEGLLTNSVLIGSEIYAPQTLREVTDEFENLLKQFYEQKFDTVLTTGPQLVPRAEALIVETQRASAKAKLEAVEKAIANLIEGKAKIYLPGRVEQLEELYKQAEEQFGQENYTITEEISLGALDEERKIVDRFDSLTQQEISVASEKLTIAESVFGAMEDIFAKPSPGPLSGDDRALEDIKLSLREELRAKLRNAKLELGLATLRREDKVFFEGIEISKRVASESEAVVQETYHVVAHNAIQEIANELTRYEREGGREYAPAELAKTEQMVLETRRMVQNQDYRDAVEHAAEAKSQLEILAEELARVAVGRIDSAQSSLEMARTRRADTYQQDRIRQVNVLIGEAQSKLSGEGLKAAIELAEQAAQLAAQAGEQAIRQWTEEELRRTDITLARARESGAESYAPIVLDEAVNLRRNAERLFQAENLVEAQAIATQAAVEAELALYAQVIKAEDEIASAKRFEGWKYDSESLAQAIILAKTSREAMGESDYRKSHSTAQRAYNIARNVSVSARRKSFGDRVRSLQAKVDSATRQGPGYFQVDELTEVIGQLQMLSADFDPDEFEGTAENIDMLDARLEALTESTPRVLREVVDYMNDLLAGLEDRGAGGFTPELVDGVSQKIRFAQLDYRNEKFRESYQNARDALYLLDELELRLDERDYDRQLTDIFGEFSEMLRDFGPVLNLGSPVLLNLVQGPTGRSQAVALLSASSPTDFKQQLSDLAARTRFIDTPSTRMELQDATLDMFNLAKSGASGFEKLLILDQYSLPETRKIIQTAYLQLRTARTQQQDIQGQLESPRASEDLTGVRRAIEVRPR